MPRYTVYGLWISDAAVVAAVVLGDHPAVDSQDLSQEFDSGPDSQLQRWAEPVDASDPGEAEVMAIQHIEADEQDRLVGRTSE
jgi:hypothetical protein